MAIDEKERREKLLQLIRDAVASDEALREKYKMGDKFRFVRDRLQNLLTKTEENLNALLVEETSNKKTLAEDETLVYVYIYNAQGIILKSWQKLLMPGVYYEYSVNRPIYHDKKFVEAFIRTRANKMQHGYLTVAVKKSDLVEQLPEDESKDILGNPVIKVREGSLHANKTISFTYNGNSYYLDEENNLKKITDDV